MRLGLNNRVESFQHNDLSFLSRSRAMGAPRVLSRDKKLKRHHPRPTLKSTVTSSEQANFSKSTFSTTSSWEIPVTAHSGPWVISTVELISASEYSEAISCSTSTHHNHAPVSAYAHHVPQ